MARVRRKITNDKTVAIQVAGRWIQPGSSEVFELEQLPPEWRNAGVEVPDTSVKKVPAMITEGRQALEIETSSDGGVGKITFPGTLKTGVPFVLCGSMSLVGGGVGAFTLSSAILTGLGVGLSGSPAFFYLPANAAGSGCESGWYYGVFSSDTAGTIYANRYSGGNPADAIPSSPAAFVGAPAVTAAVAQTTSEVDAIYGYTIPAGFFGKNCDLTWSYKAYGDSVSLKTYRLKIGSTAALYDLTSAAQDVERTMVLTQNGTLNRQQASRSSSGVGVTGTSLSGDFLSIDMSIDQPLKITMQLGSAGGSMVLGRSKIRIED